jgi:hypothetical protein
LARDEEEDFQQALGVEYKERSGDAWRMEADPVSQI